MCGASSIAFWCRRFNLKRQPKIFKQRLGPVPNPVLEHPGPFTHHVHGQKISFQEVEQVERIAGHRYLDLPLHLHRIEGWQTADGLWARLSPEQITTKNNEREKNNHRDQKGHLGFA
jgi:hypothetical protein